MSFAREGETHTLGVDTGYVWLHEEKMKNITLALDEETLEAGREYAQRHNTTLNNLVRELLRKTALGDRRTAAREMIRLMEDNPGRSSGIRWTRAQLHER